ISMRICLAMLLSLVPLTASAQTVTTVTTEAQLREAISAAAPGDRIVFGANITLTADLPVIATDITLDGDGHTLSGNNQFRGLTVGNQSDGALSIAVTIQNISIADAVARGGSGGSGSAGGG